ncbi:MAG: polysaccharide pyruvyl transferase CsaB, partial [Bryobacteraceae bacterium]
MTRNHIFLTGYYGFGNAGDEAILTAILAHLRTLQPGLQITVTSGEPEKTAATYGVTAIPWSHASGILEAIRGTDMVIIGGGGLFQDYWGVDPDALLSDNHSGISFYATSAVLAALYGKPLMLYAIGAGPLLSSHGKLFTKAICEAAQVITVRDDGSRQLLESLEVPASKMQLTADPVFALPWSHSPGSPSTKRKIGVSLRNWNIDVDPGFWQSEVAAALDRFLQNEPAVDIEFFPFQKLTGEIENDVAVSRRVRDLMQSQNRVHIVEEELSPAELAARMAACELIVGMRLHAIIFSVLANVPAIALSYDPKVEQLMQRLELQRFCLDIKSIESLRLASLMQEVLRNGAKLRESIGHPKSELAQQARGNASVAIAVLRNEPNPRQPLSAGVSLLLRHSIKAQLQTINAGRTEAARLLKEVEFYLEESRRNAGRLEELSQLMAKKETSFGKTVNARNKEIARLTSRISQLEKESGKQEKAYTARLQHAEQVRQKAVHGLHQYQEALQQTIVSHRNEKAWQIMLVLRKAYTLLFRRGLFPFCKWVLSWPVQGPGGLVEYDVRFPGLSSYLPERLGEAFPTSGGIEAEEEIEAAVPPAPSLAEILPQQTYDVVIFPVFDFEFRFQRPQQIAAEFARRGHRVFWLSPGRHLPLSHPKRYEAIQLRPDLWEIHFRGENLDIYSGSLTEEDAAPISTGLREVYRDFAINENCVVLQFPFWRRLGLGLRQAFNSRIIYDCMDDWQNWTAEPRISQWNLEEEKNLAREADVLVVTAQELYERQQAFRPDPVLARNAADFDFLSKPRPNNLITDLSKPVIGYFGAIADWFDLDLVMHIARLRPQYNFFFIGHVYELNTAKIQSLPNVTFLGERNYREIPLFLSHFDVCLIPFVLNDLIKGVDPVKMYEYFSQGKPVVATDMPELAPLKDLVYIGRNAEDFAAKLDAAVREDDPHLRRRRIEYAKANTWAARVDVIDAAIRKSFPKVSILVAAQDSKEVPPYFFDSVQRNTAWPNYEILMDSEAREASGEYLVFLNPRTLVPPGWLERLARHCRRDPSIA